MPTTKKQPPKKKLAPAPRLRLRCLVEFLSSGLRQKVDQLMDILWAGGVNNPMDSIEQISYLLFLRLLTEKDENLAVRQRQEVPAHFRRQMGPVCLGQLCHSHRRPAFQRRPRRHRKPSRAAGLTETGKLLFSRATLKFTIAPRSAP